MAGVIGRFQNGSLDRVARCPNLLFFLKNQTQRFSLGGSVFPDFLETLPEWNFVRRRSRHSPADGSAHKTSDYPPSPENYGVGTVTATCVESTLSTPADVAAVTT